MVVVELTVFLIRCGESEDEAFDNAMLLREKENEEEEKEEEENNDVNPHHDDDDDDDDNDNVDTTTTPNDHDTKDDDTSSDGGDNDDDEDDGKHAVDSRVRDDDDDTKAGLVSEITFDESYVDDDDNNNNKVRRRNNNRKSRDDGGQPPIKTLHENIPKLLMRQRLDPNLTEDGFEQIQMLLTHLFHAIGTSTTTSETTTTAEDEEQKQEHEDNQTKPTTTMTGGQQQQQQLRRMAAFCAPMKSCIGSSLLMSCARLPKHDNIMFGLTTHEAASSPLAIPVIVMNELCNTSPEVIRLGGVNKVVNAGLLHCAADISFNNVTKSRKSPMMKCIMNMKDMTQDRVEAWKKDGTNEDKRRVTDVQYLHMPEPTTNPWSLEMLLQQVNILVDFVEPSKYLTPPRKGSFEPKMKNGSGGGGRPKAQEDLTNPEPALRRAVFASRLAGCDTVLCFVPCAVIQQMEQRQQRKQKQEEQDEEEEKDDADANENANDNEKDDDDQQKEKSTKPPRPLPPCSLGILKAHVHGDNESTVEFHVEGVYTPEELLEADPSITIMPKWNGPINRIVQPPEGKDPWIIPMNQWSRFPPPPPENIPDDYPDLVPFSKALDVPMPSIQPRKKKPRPPPPPPQSSQPRSPPGKKKPMSSGAPAGRPPPPPPPKSPPGKKKPPMSKAPTSPGKVTTTAAAQQRPTTTSTKYGVVRSSDGTQQQEQEQPPAEQAPSSPIKSPGVAETVSEEEEGT